MSPLFNNAFSFLNEGRRTPNGGSLGYLPAAGSKVSHGTDLILQMLSLRDDWSSLSRTTMAGRERTSYPLTSTGTSTGTMHTRTHAHTKCKKKKNEEIASFPGSAHTLEVFLTLFPFVDSVSCRTVSFLQDLNVRVYCVHANRRVGLRMEQPSRQTPGAAHPSTLPLSPIQGCTQSAAHCDHIRVA